MANDYSLTQPCPVTLECPPSLGRPEPPWEALPRYMFSVRGKSVLDLDCGPGLFGIVAAKMGAREVWAVDSRPAAVDCTRKNAERNGAEIRAKVGDGFDPLGGRRFDLIVVHPPQMPGPPEARRPALAGADGLKHFDIILREAPEYLDDGGQLLTWVTSLAHVERFESMLGERFRFRALPQTRTPFERGELESLWPGLFAYLGERQARGLAAFEVEGEKLIAWTRYYMAQKK